MGKNKVTQDKIPENFETIEDAADFWDQHDLSDYWALTEKVDFEVELQRRRYLVALAPELIQELTEEAHRRGLSTETLINLWLKDKLQESAA